MCDKNVLPNHGLEGEVEGCVCTNSRNTNEEKWAIQSPCYIQYSGNLLDESESDDDLFLGTGGEVHQLIPSSYFTDEDILLNLTSPSGCASMQTDATRCNKAPLEGPGVLRGVCIPAEKPKKKKRDRNGGSNRNKRAAGTVESCRISEKPSSRRNRDVRNSMWTVKALTVSNLKDDDDYRR